MVIEWTTERQQAQRSAQKAGSGICPEPTEHQKYSTDNQASQIRDYPNLWKAGLTGVRWRDIQSHAER